VADIIGFSETLVSIYQARCHKSQQLHVLHTHENSDLLRHGEILVQRKRRQGEERVLRNVRFEAFTTATVKNAVFLDVTQCGSC
jgi:hypothetical protein